MSETPAPTIKERNPLVEKLGKDNVRKLAAVGLALGALFGVGNKANTGASIGISVHNPMTGAEERAGVGISLTEEEGTLGIPNPDPRNYGIYAKLKSYEVEVNGVRFYVYVGEESRDPEKYGGDMVTILAVRPGFETTLGSK